MGEVAKMLLDLSFPRPHMSQKYKLQSVGKKKQGLRLILQSPHFGRRGINLELCFFGQQSAIVSVETNHVSDPAL